MEMTELSSLVSTAQDTGYVDIIRYSNNPQKKRFGDTYLPSFHYRDEAGTLQRKTFLSANEKESPLVIGNGGTVRLYKNKFPDSHNIESAKALVSANPSPLPPGMLIRIVDHADIASQKVEGKRRQMEAMNRVGEKEGEIEFLASMARRLAVGDALMNMTQMQVLDFVLDKAQSDPDLVLSILEDANQQDLFDVDAAKAARIIEKQSGHWYFLGKLLGKTDQDILMQLRRDGDMKAELTRRITQLRNQTPMVAGSVKFDESNLDTSILNAELVTVDEPSPTDPLTTVALAKLLKDAGRTMVDGLKGKTVSVVHFKPGEGFFYGNIPLGSSSELASVFLRKNPAIRQQIERMVEEHGKNSD